MLKDNITALEDSNIANYGGKDMRDAKLAAAQSAEEWKGCGQLPANKKQLIEVWRIENFQVQKWPRSKYGQFFSGDSYIVLRSYRKEGEQDTEYDVHFWLGESTSIDERGTAAYKTVELDDLFGDKPVQYRECQGHESKKFLSLFSCVTYLSGGIDSGFNPVKPETYVPRLMHFKGKGKQIRMEQVDSKCSSLNQGDVFLLDLGLELIQWNGPHSNIREKRKAMELIQDLKESRNGRPTSRILDGDEDDEVFWTQLGGKGEIGEATPDEEVKAKPPTLVRLSDASGSLTLTEVATGTLQRSMLTSDDVYIVDTGVKLYVFLGRNVSKNEKKQAMPHALQYLENAGMPTHTPITRILQGKESHGFNRIFE